MAQVLIITDRPEDVIQPPIGPLPTHTSAYFVEIPEGKTALEAAQEWVSDKSFQIGTEAEVIDLTNISRQKFSLRPNWVPIS